MEKEHWRSMLPIMSGDVRTPDLWCCLVCTILTLAKGKLGSFVACIIYWKAFLKRASCFVSKSAWILVVTDCYFRTWDTTSFLLLEGEKRIFLRPSVIQNLLILPIYVKHLPEEGKMIERKGRKKSKTERRMEVGRERGKNSFPACSWDDEVMRW